jgi:hypothetical protein
MERQCRLCFETDETSQFLSPCDCRGTQAYIHTHCLALYMQHYPDGICRVCRSHMKPLHDVAFMYGMFTAAWMLTIGYASTLPSEPRGMYLMLTAGFILYCFILRQMPIWLGVLGMLMSSTFLYASPSVLFWTLLWFSALLTGIVLWMYIPLAFLMLGAVILFSAFYSTVFVLIVLANNEPAVSAMLICAMMFLWYLAIRARPPQRIV